MAASGIIGAKCPQLGECHTDAAATPRPTCSCTPTIPGLPPEEALFAHFPGGTHASPCRLLLAEGLAFVKGQEVDLPFACGLGPVLLEVFATW